MTPFRSSLPVNTILTINMLRANRAPLIGKMRPWLGMLNWLSQGTHPDIATIFSLLASHSHSPSPGHLEGVKHVGRYLKSTAKLGLLFSSHGNKALEAYVYFPVNEHEVLTDGHCVPTLTAYCDANWGPQDASVPGPSKTKRQVSMDETRSICGHVPIMGGAPVFRKTRKESHDSHSSCEVEVKAADECIKSV